MKKYYAIKKGRQTGIFTSWDETKSLVSGFNGAIYKSFKTKEERGIRGHSFAYGWLPN